MIAYLSALFLTATISIITIFFVWQRRSTPATLPLLGVLFAVTEWSFAAALETISPEVQSKIFWSVVAYVGITTSPVFLLMFTIEYNRSEKWMTLPRLSGFLIIPLLSTLAAATNEWHHALWTDVVLPPHSNFAVYGHGGWFWIHISYSYVLLMVGTFILLRAFYRFAAAYRRQIGVFLFSLTIPWLSNIIYIFDLSPVSGMDLTPVAFASTGLIIAWSMYRFQLFDLVPVARERMIENMNVGVIVLDAQNRIVDINPAAQRFIGEAANHAIGKYAKEVLSAWAALVNHYRDVQETRAEICARLEPPLHLELQIAPLYDRYQQFSGRLITLHNITARILAEEAAHHAHKKLQAQLSEIQSLQADLREQAIRDPLTNAFNRRYMIESLERELARASREHSPLSIVMIDIDHFKNVNDTFGHKAGDLMLNALCDLVRERTRGMDMLCRYGGEEFVVVLPGATLVDAHQRAQEWRATFENLRVRHEGKEMRATISLGVAAFPQSGETIDEILRVVDSALYAAKSEGRNRVKMWS
jgi:diguanylate cyclase (GGDEF)-like protein/PAS domain S-box-containing protein